MGKIIINESNPFFDVGGKEGDVMYSFTGYCGPMSIDSVLYGKTINLSEMYENMVKDVKEFLFGGEFIILIGESKGSITQLVNAYTFKKYGISIESVYNKIQKNANGTRMTTDIIFNELKVKYGIAGIDWMYLYNNLGLFQTNDTDVLENIGNKIVSTNDFYKYFVNEYNLRCSGVVKNKNNNNCLKMEWKNGGSKEIQLAHFVLNYNQWWRNSAKKSNKNRDDIRDYDVLLNGRSVTEVFPVYCPVFSNLRLNYTGIDFDGKKRSNIKKCSEIAGYGDKGETWSFASIDRIDSNKGYSYDNIRIISHYANIIKNVGNIDQMRRLVQYMDEQSRYF
jgi:hypothetical protein